MRDYAITGARALAWVWLTIISTAPILGDTGFRYFYDDSDQLFRVLDSTGTLLEYIYDPSGNIAAINRSTIAPGALSILNISPLTAGVGSSITIAGQDFAATAAGNTVMINGVAATVLSAASTQLTIQIPPGATSGQITVTVNGVTVSSGATLVFTPGNVPLIASITPNLIFAGTTNPNVAITGTGLAGALFSFPYGASANATTTSANSASLYVSAVSNTRGVFPLVATTSAGSSPNALNAGNQLYVLLSPDEADGPAITVLNTAAPISQSTDPTNVSSSADSQVVSVLNTVSPISQSADPTNIANEADSTLVSLNNSTSTDFKTAAATPLSRVTSFAQGTTAQGVIEIGPTNTTGRLVAGQTLILGVRAPADTAALDILLAGIPAGRSTHRPYLFTLQVPQNSSELNLTAIATSIDGSQLAVYPWTQPVGFDAGTVIAGRLENSEGRPMANASIIVEITGSCGASAALLPAGFCLASSSTLMVPNDGEYSFNGPKLAIDGSPVEGRRFLRAGPHTVELLPDSLHPPINQLQWRGPDGLEQAIPPESLITANPALQARSDPSGAFRIPNVPATAEGVRIRIVLPDGRKATSPWQSPINGGITDVGNLTVRENK